jgi:hypothetical protein
LPLLSIGRFELLYYYIYIGNVNQKTKQPKTKRKLKIKNKTQIKKKIKNKKTPQKKGFVFRTKPRSPAAVVSAGPFSFSSLM